MIEIKCAAADTAKRLCQSVCVSADRVWEMTERDTRLGFSCVQTDGDEGTITYLKAPDCALADALLRATLNALLAEEVKRVGIAWEELKNEAVCKGYIPSKDQNIIEIKDFFAKSACNG